MTDARLRVLRLIEIEGPRDWVLTTLDKAWLQPGSPSPLGDDKSIREIARHTVAVRSVQLMGDEQLLRQTQAEKER